MVLPTKPLTLKDFLKVEEIKLVKNTSFHPLHPHYTHQQLCNYPPVSVYDLASNMGTSVRVIESNYGDRDNVARGHKMGRKSWDTNSDNNDKNYPFLVCITSNWNLSCSGHCNDNDLTENGRCTIP